LKDFQGIVAEKAQAYGPFEEETIYMFCVDSGETTHNILADRYRE
jgi:hypothetical protein